MGNPKVAFILNSKRPFENFGKIVLDNVFRQPNKSNYDFEVLVNLWEEAEYAIPKDSKCSRIKFFVEKNEHGGVYGFNKLIRYCNEEVEHICFLPDEIIYTGDLFGLFDILNSQEFANKRFKVLGPLLDGGQYFMNGIIDYNNNIIHVPDLQGLPMVRALCASKTTINEEFGGFLLHPSFFNGACDIYISWFMNYYGEPGKEYNVANGRAFQNSIEDSSSLNTNIRNRDYETLFDLIEQCKKTGRYL